MNVFEMKFSIICKIFSYKFFQMFLKNIFKRFLRRIILNKIVKTLQSFGKVAAKFGGAKGK